MSVTGTTNGSAGPAWMAAASSSRVPGAKRPSVTCGAKRSTRPLEPSPDKEQSIVAARPVRAWEVTLGPAHRTAGCPSRRNTPNLSNTTLVPDTPESDSDRRAAASPTCSPGSSPRNRSVMWHEAAGTSLMLGTAKAKVALQVRSQSAKPPGRGIATNALTGGCRQGRTGPPS